MAKTQIVPEAPQLILNQEVNAKPKWEVARISTFAPIGSSQELWAAFPAGWLGNAPKHCARDSEKVGTQTLPTESRESNVTKQLVRVTIKH